MLGRHFHLPAHSLFLLAVLHAASKVGYLRGPGEAVKGPIVDRGRRHVPAFGVGLVEAPACAAAIATLGLRGPVLALLGLGRDALGSRDDLAVVVYDLRA